MTDITLYHNPSCSKSRQTLQLLEDQGHKPEIVLYLNEALSILTLAAIVKMLGVQPHDIIRTGESAYTSEMSDWEDNELFAAIQKHPILMQRPIVVANGQAKIGRPPEAVLEIL